MRGFWSIPQQVGKMEGLLSLLVVAVLATSVLCVPDERLKRSYEDGHGGGGPSGYGVDSDERENASIDDHAPCGLLEDNSGSPERGYEFNQRPGQESNRGYSVKAAAAASSSTYS